MSLSSQLTRVAGGTKDTLKALINALGGNITTETIDQYAAKVAAANIVNKTYVDTADGTKADKKVPSTAGNIATLDASGNLVDSGTKPADFAGSTHAATHKTGGADPITPADIGAAVEALETSTKAKFAPDAPSTLNEALSLLGRFNAGLGNEYVWSKTKSKVVVSVASNTTAKTAASVNSTVSYSSSASISNGSVVLDNPQSVTLDFAYNTDKSILNGKYCIISDIGSSVIYVISTSYNSSTSNTTINYKAVSAITEVILYGYVNSPSSDAYPPSVSDGYTYTALGQGGSKVRMASGSYTGTGTYGSANPCSLTFDFVPKIVIVSSNGLTPGYYYWNSGGFVWTSGQTRGSLGAEGNCTFTISANTLSWYTTNNANTQCNIIGTTYNYIVIG